MNNPFPGSSEGSTEDPPPRKDAEPIPASLSEFLVMDKASARRFVKSLGKGPALKDDDLTHSRAIIDAEPTKMNRVVDLARAATASATQPGPLLRWCEQIVRSRHEALSNWALDPGQDVATAFGELLKWARPFISRNADRANRQLAEACLLTGLNVLIARRSLRPLDALRFLAMEIGIPAGRRGSPGIERATTKQLTRAGVKQLVELAQIAVLSEKEIISAEEARRAAVTLGSDLRREKEALTGERDTLRAEVLDLVQQVQQRDARIRELSSDLEGARVRALQDLDQLKARFRREIGEGLAGLLADAWDAIDTDPPHPAVARERLEIAREAIRREMEWLGKSSD